MHGKVHDRGSLVGMVFGRAPYNVGNCGVRCWLDSGHATSHNVSCGYPSEPQQVYVVACESLSDALCLYIYVLLYSTYTICIQCIYRLLTDRGFHNI